ncbi:CHAP domain-containing protein [Micromonospora sp. HM134]|uniref:CHAP domain-containing protein n=1 Tax=Micromonospora sp. HM134 TaxID=2583243 RepID=UPI00143E0A75|nr:CHAP domain-containing protein [Micromonospora sp. HM134]
MLIATLSAVVGFPPGSASAGLNEDDYPSNLKSAPLDSMIDPWGFYNRNCTSFVAWRINQLMGRTSAPWAFTNGMAGGRWGNANHWDDNARGLGYPVDGTPKVGAIAQTDAGSSGHVAVVTAVNGNEVSIEEYNRSFTGSYGTRRVSAASFTYIHIPGAEPTTGGEPNSRVVSLPGNWTGDSREDFVYITRRADGGFDLAVMETTSAGLAWRGLWWSEPTQRFDTTKFIPADTDNDGRLDLYYATARPGGFDVALMHNTGNTFSWWGHQWNPNMDLTKITFLPGNWVGDPREEFAYVTPRGSGGFDFAVMETTDAGFVWRGLWWSDDNLSFATIAFVPADNDNDGKLDLFYASPNANGFDLALMHNSGSAFTWWGHQWNPTGLSLTNTRFLPGNWGGSPAGDFAYVTPRGDGGFDLAAFISTPTGIVWQERLHEPGLSSRTVQFVTADATGDGLSDLYYVTPRGGGGFTMALFDNTGAAFAWAGEQWNPSSLSQQQTIFLPQG